MTDNDDVYLKCRECLKEIFEYWQEEIKDCDVMDFPQNRLFPFIKSSNSFKLYRYMPSDYFSIRNIETQKIHLSPNGVMNDIYEGVPIIDEHLSEISKLSDLAYMTCFSETNNSVLMWSHYANSHKGLCVEYDIKKLFNSDSNEILNNLFPVIYNEKRMFRWSKNDILSLIDDHKELSKAIDERYEYEGNSELNDILPMFLIKGTPWEYEREWRIIYTKKQIYDIDDEILYGKNLPFNCVSSIYLGYRIHPEIKNNIIEICDRLSDGITRISLYQSRISKDSFNLEFHEIKK